VKLDHMPAAGLLMQAICVLRRNRDEMTAGLESRESMVARIGTSRKRDTPSVFRDLPVRAWIGHEVCD
jgi:hypothetical protein